MSSPPNAATSDTWSLSVKAIGSTIKDCTAADHGSLESLDSPPEKNFTVTVSPNDALTELYDQIETATGLKASQQRLIYRGRLIDKNRPKDDSDVATTKIGDIVGLSDGHTIHLVKRQENVQDPQAANNTNTSAAASATTSMSTLEREEAGNGTASLLAALIGLGGLDDDNDSPTVGRQRWRSGRLGRSRRPHYRLTADDLQAPDPGNLEPVRQGLMTIHTMLPHAQVSETTNLNLSPLAANRRWYRGQWIDVRDTVNQWLEATIVDIVRPEDVLPPRETDDHDTARELDIFEPASDPAVSAGDLEGRRHLLLEPCDEGDAEEEGGELTGFRRRKTNPGVQLLMVHYNGWPHRWDEWIRSDSERIRPFRTRTRHSSMATHASPTIQSAFNEAPFTYIVDEDNSLERHAILPELTRSISAVNDLLAAVAADESALTTQEQREHLPWAVLSSPNPSDSVGENNACDEDDDLDELPPLSGEDDSAADIASSSQHSSAQPRLRRCQLQMLAPLLDRLGRTLIDVAPHVAALAQAPPDHDAEASISTAEAVVAPQPTVDETNPSTLGGLLSLLSRDRLRHSNINASPGNDAASAAPEQTWHVDPDYLDFATGAVNITRGEVRNGPRSRAPNDDVAGLLGAYLAAASLGLNTMTTTGTIGAASDPGNNEDAASNVMGLGRLLRDRGNGGGNSGAGIDIHIHAVVTAPGIPPPSIGGTGAGVVGGGLGFTTLGSPHALATATARNPLASLSRERRANGGSSMLRLRTPSAADDDDDLGLFSDLYSESPEPVDPNGNPLPGSQRAEGAAGGVGDLLSRLGHTSSRASNESSSRSDPVSSSPSRMSSTNSDSSSRRSSSNNNGSSPRRGSMLGRLFRRSRRQNGADS